MTAYRIRPASKFYSISTQRIGWTFFNSTTWGYSRRYVTNSKSIFNYTVMAWLLILGLILIFVLPEIYSKSSFAKKHKGKRELNRPYNYKWAQLVSKLNDVEKYNDWKSKQLLRIDLLWLQTIYSYKFSTRSSFKIYGSDDVDIQSIKASFKKTDIITPDTFSFSDKRHIVFTENIAAQFEDVFFKINETDRKIEENPEYRFDREREKTFFDQKYLPFPKDYIEKALLFQYAYNTEYPERIFGMQIMTPEYIKELITKLENFK